MKFVKRKVTTTKSKHSSADFAQLKEAFLNGVVTTVEMEEIPAELILNWDKTGSKSYRLTLGPWTSKVRASGGRWSP